MNLRKFTFGILFSGTALVWGLLAQTSGTLSGTITSSKSGAVPSASITVTDSAGQSRSVIAGQDGTFTITNLPPGTYRVDVEAPGFKRLSQENVQISPGTPVNLSLGVEPGNQNETVEVQGQTPLVQDENAQLARAYAGRTLNQLPVQDLNHSQLVELMPGITLPASSGSIVVDPQQNRVWNTNGQPAQSNNQKVDGVENLEPLNGIAVHVPTIGSIQQMNLVTHNYDASEGRAAGSILMPGTKSGTNGLHGSLFEYNANNWARARDYFDPKPLPQARYNSNQFGGTLGGAILPNKTFFFLSYEGDYLRDQNPQVTTVPNAAFRSGDFSAFLPYVTIYNPFTGAANGTGRQPFANNQVPASLFNPQAQALLNSLPQANFTGYENNYVGNAAIINDGNRADGRVDHRFTDKSSVFLRYGLSYYNTIQESLLGALGQSASSRLRTHDATAAFTHGFGPNTFTDLRLSYTRYSNPISAYNSLGSGLYGFAGNLPDVQIAGMQSVGTNPNYPQVNKEDTYNIVNTWNARVHNHDLRFGVDLWQIRMDGFQNLPYGPAAGYGFGPGATSIPGLGGGQPTDFANSFAAFLLGTATQSGITTSSYVPSYISRQFGGFIADRINLMSRLTLDLGLRYDYFSPIEPRNNAGLYSMFDPATNMLMPLAANGIDRAGNVASNTLNFAPRIGLAYRFNDRTVVRAGYGMSYWNPLQYGASTLIPSLTAAAYGVNGGYAASGILGATPVVTSSNVAPNQALYYSPSRVRTPYVQFFNFNIQRDLTHGVLAEIGYVGNLGRELPYTLDTNAAVPGTGVASVPYASIGRTAPTLLRGTGYTSNYNALQVNLTKRFSQGISFTAAYTYSKSLDYGAGLEPFLNNLNPSANYGPSDFDRTHIFTLSHNWRLPFGAGTQHLNEGVLGKILGPWELNGIFRYASGMPFTPTASAAACNCPGNTATADVVPGPTYTGIGYYPGYFGFGFFGYYAYPYLIPTYAFAQPSAGSFGNVGRNAVRGPDFTNYDLALSRSFVFVEQTRLEFRAEAYNIANSVHFANPITNVNSPNFGQSISTMPGLGARTLQFALRLTF